MGTVNASLENQDDASFRSSRSCSWTSGCSSAALPQELISAQMLVSASERVHNRLRKYILIQFQNQHLSPISLSQENVERKVSNVECHTEYGKKCHTEYKQKCGTEYTTECHKVPTTRLVKKTEMKCTRDRYGKKTCKNQDKYVTVRDTEKKCERKAQEKCNRVPHEVCENKPHEVCHNVLTKKTDKYPSHLNCKTVQKKVCY